MLTFAAYLATLSTPVVGVVVVVVVVVVDVATRVFRIPPFLKIDGLFEDMHLMIEEFLANKKEHFKNCQTNSFWKQPDLVGIGEQ